MKLTQLFSFKGSSSTILTNLAIVVSIIVVLNLLVHLAIPTFYDEPTQHQFCKDVATVFDYSTKDKCSGIGGTWQTYETSPGFCDTSLVEQYTDEKTHQTYSIKRGDACITQYQDAHQIYQRNGFLVILGVFVVALIVGLQLHAFPPAAYGLIYGSVILLVSGTIRYWQGIGDYWRLGLLAAALGILLWLGIRLSMLKKAEKK